MMAVGWSILELSVKSDQDFERDNVGEKARRRRLSAELARVFHLARGCAISGQQGALVLLLTILGFSLGLP
jgi:hypothetical protein